MTTIRHPVVEAAWAVLEHAADTAGPGGVWGGALVSLPFADLHALLSLLEGTEAHPSSAANELVCDECGHGQGLTVMIPPDAWDVVAPGPCGRCMDRLLAERGVQGPVEGNGPL